MLDLEAAGPAFGQILSSYSLKVCGNWIEWYGTKGTAIGWDGRLYSLGMLAWCQYYVVTYGKDGKVYTDRVATLKTHDPAIARTVTNPHGPGSAILPLDPGETTTVSLELNERSFAYYDIADTDWASLRARVPTTVFHHGPLPASLQA